MKGLPTASVTGQQGWEWNRRFVERQPSRPEVKGAVDVPDPDPPRIVPEGCGVDPCGFEILRIELGRKERERQHVIDRYEQLLREKNRELATEEGEEPANEPTAVPAGILRWFADR